MSSWSDEVESMGRHLHIVEQGVRRSSMVRTIAHGAMGQWIDPLWSTH